MSPEGVRGAAFLPRDGYLDPSQLTFALADGARHYGAELNTRTRVTSIERDARGRVCRVVTDKGEIETEVVVNAAGMAAPDVGRLVGVTVPDHPDGAPVPDHRAVRPAARAAADAARPGQPRLLAHGGRRTRDGRLRARSRAVRAGRHPRGFRGAAPDLGLRALRGAHGGLDPPRARDGGRRGQEVLQRPGGLHAGRRVHPRRVRGARLLGRRRILRARPRGCRRHRQGHGRVDRRRPAGVGSVAHGHPALRPPVPLAELHARAHRRGVFDATTTSSTPARSARPGGRCACRPPMHGIWRTGPASARNRAGSGSTGSSRTRSMETRRCALAAGPGRTGRLRSRPSARPPASAPC